MARALITLTILGFAPSASAQPAPPAATDAAPGQPETYFGKLVITLDAPEYLARQQAMELLSTSDFVTLEMIEQALAGRELSGEQRQRLMEAGRSRFSRTPRAAMGVMFDQTGPLRDRIVVDNTFDKFPCFTILQEGDIIDGAAGVRLIGPGSRVILRSLIFSRDPGEVITLVVLRGAQRLDLRVPLGRYQDLPNNGPLDDPSLTRAWRVRAVRHAGGAEPIRTSLTTEQWRDADDAMRQRQGATMQTKAALTGAARSAPVAGGTARARVSDDGAMARWNSTRDPEDLMMERAGWRFGQFGEEADVLARRTMSTADEVRALEQLADAYRRKLFREVDGDVGQIANRPRTAPGETLGERQVRLIDKELAAIKAEAAGN